MIDFLIVKNIKRIENAPETAAFWTKMSQQDELNQKNRK